MSSTSSQAGSSGTDKGPEAVQHMLEGQDNRKLSGAKEALKKKILRLVMQQALEELGDADALAGSSLEDIGLEPEDQTRLTDGIKKHLIANAATQVTEADFDEIAEAAAQAALDNSEADAAAGRVERKLLAAISEKALTGLADDGTTIKTAFESIAEANADAIDALAESVQDKLSGTVAAKAWSNGIDADRVVALAADNVDTENPAVSDAIERIQATAGDLILQHVLAQLSGDETAGSLAAEVSRRFKERLMGMVTERVTSDPQAIAEELQAELGHDHDAVVTAVRMTRGIILDTVRERAIASIGDARSAAREALVEIEEDNPQIQDAATALTRRLTKDIADRALEQLGDAETAAGSALKIARESDEVIETASNSVYETMARHVAEQARERCSDADQLADAARDYMDPKDGNVSRAVSLLQNRLTEMVANRAIASLEDDDRMRELAKEAARREEAIVEASVEALRDDIMADIVRQVGESFSDAGETARRAKQRMGEGNAAVIAASEVLKELVLEELAKQATFTLLEPDKTGAKAFDRIDTQDPRFVRTTDNVKERLVEAIAEHSLEAIGGSDETAQEARRHISDTHDAIVSATAVLRDILITEIAHRGTDALGDTRTIAQQSRGRIEPENEAIADASAALRELLIEDMVQMTRAALQDADAAALEAMGRLDSSDEVIDRVRGVFKERVLINVLGEAMREIGQSVGGPNQEAAMFQHALKAMSSRSSARAGAWNGSGYEPTESAPQENQADRLSAEPPSFTLGRTSWPSTEAAAHPSAWDSPPVTEVPAAPVSTPVATAPSRSAAPTSAAESPAAPPVKAPRSTFFEDWDVPDTSGFPGEAASTDGWVRLSDIKEGSDRVVALDPPEPVDDMIVTEFVDHEAEAYEAEPPTGPEPEAVAEAALAEAESVQESDPEESQDIDMTWEADDGLRCYTYGYVSAAQVAAAPPKGVESLAKGHPVRLVTLRGVRAIISKVPAAEFSHESLAAKSKDPEWLKAQIRQHASVLDTFKTLGTVMPVRFGSVRDNEADVAVRMGEEYDNIVATLERLTDKQEWSLRITRDADRLKEKLDSAERIVEDSLDAISTGVAQFIKDELSKSGELAEDELVATVTENCIRRAHDALMPWADDGAQKALVTAPGVDLVFNAAYLVETGRTSDFQAEVDRLSAELEPAGFTFDVTGPWPAYHFVDTDNHDSAEFVTAVE